MHQRQWQGKDISLIQEDQHMLKTCLGDSRQRKSHQSRFEHMEGTAIGETSA